MSSEPTKKLTRKEKKQRVANLKTDIIKNLVTVDEDPDAEAKKIGHDSLDPILEEIPAMEKSLNNLGQYYVLRKHSPHSADIHDLESTAKTGYTTYKTMSQEKKEKRDPQPTEANRGTYVPIREEVKSLVGHQDNCPYAPQGGSAPIGTYSPPVWGPTIRIDNNRGVSPIQEQAYPNSTPSHGGMATNTDPEHRRPSRAASGISPYDFQPNYLSAPQGGPASNDYPAYDQPAQAVSSDDTLGRLAGRVPIQNLAYARAIGQGRTVRPGSHSTPRGVPSPTPSVALRRLSTPGPELTPLHPPPRNRYVNRAATEISMANASGSSNANNSLQRSNTFGSVRYSTTSGSDQSMVNQARFSAQSEGSST